MIYFSSHLTKIGFFQFDYYQLWLPLAGRINCQLFPWYWKYSWGNNNILRTRLQLRAMLLCLRGLFVKTTMTDFVYKNGSSAKTNYTNNLVNIFHQKYWSGIQWHLINPYIWVVKVSTKQMIKYSDEFHKIMADLCYTVAKTMKGLNIRAFALFHQIC